MLKQKKGMVFRPAKLDKDVENLEDPAFRERFAGAVVQAVKAYYRN